MLYQGRRTFYYNELRVDNPLIDFTIYHNHPFMIGNNTAFLNFAVILPISCSCLLSSKCLELSIIQGRADDGHFPGLHDYSRTYQHSKRP
jgi:hypothetical protein